MFIHLLFMAMKVELSRDRRASKVLNICYMLFKEKLLTSEIEVDGGRTEQIWVREVNNSTEGMLSFWMIGSFLKKLGGGCNLNRWRSFLSEYMGK